MSRPGIRVLILSNTSGATHHVGQIDGYRLLVDSGEIAGIIQYSHLFRENINQKERELIARIADAKFDVVLIWTPKQFPNSKKTFEKLLGIIGKRPIYYYDGDPWLQRYRHLHKPNEKKKSVTTQMKWWAKHSEEVFTVSSSEHFNIFQNLGARVVNFMPHTYCHILNQSGETVLPQLNAEFDVIMIGSNLASVPFVTGAPGSFRRLQLASKLRNQKNIEFKLYGEGWPKSWDIQPVPFENQIQEIRRARLSVNWDHFDKYSDYASDRLPISLLSGRPHVTTKHPGMTWIPGEEIGLFQEESPSKVREKIIELLETDPLKLYQLGVEGQRWVTNRLSHRQAARYIMSKITTDVTPPSMKPWTNLPSVSFFESK